MSEKMTLTRWLDMQRGGMTGNQAAPVVTMLASNGSGGAVARGDVVVMKKTSSSTADLFAFTTTTTADNVDVMGMVYDSSIANGSIGKIQIWGPTDALKVDGTTDIAIGDYISTFTVAKIGAKANPGEGVFALALEAYTANNSLGVIDAFITRLDFVRSQGKTIASGSVLVFQAAQGSYANLIQDVNGNEILDTQAVASALNQFGISNGATGNGPILEARGEANVDINLLAKGTGAVTFDNGTDPVLVKLKGAAAGYNNSLVDVNANELIDFQGVASAVTQFGITNGATGVGPTLSSRGEANVDINILCAGTGAFIVDNGTDPVLVKLKGAAAGYNNSITDVNGNELLDFQGVASALNEFGITNGATGVGPTLSARGETNVDINILAKGTGVISLDNGTDPVLLKFLGAQAGYNNSIIDVNANELMDLYGVASAVNQFAISNAATNTAPILEARGGDAQIGMTFLAKGGGAKGWILDKVGHSAFNMASTTATDTATLTLAQMRSQLVIGTPTGAASYTTPTAAALVGDIQGAEVGTTFLFTIYNNSGGANTITLVGGASVTLYGTATVAQSIARNFLVTFTNVTGASEAVSIYSI